MNRYQPLLEATAGWAPPVRLDAFSGVRGATYNGELLVVGRAVNRWENSFTTADLGVPERRYAIASELEAGRQDPGKLAWVANQWGTREEYNPARSAFWRVIRRVQDGLGLSVSREWSSDLAWSNLYRVAPSDGGNPPASLMRVQHRACSDLLVREIEELVPRRILFLTGADWFSPFAGTLGLVAKAGHTGGEVQLTGRIASGGGEAAVVVARHPQGKDETQWVADVLNAFTELAETSRDHGRTSVRAPGGDRRPET
jgi:hypothetical protein